MPKTKARVKEFLSKQPRCAACGGVMVVPVEAAQEAAVKNVIGIAAGVALGAGAIVRPLPRCTKCGSHQRRRSKGEERRERWMMLVSVALLAGCALGWLCFHR